MFSAISDFARARFFLLNGREHFSAGLCRECSAGGGASEIQNKAAEIIESLKIITTPIYLNCNFC
ncbi:MAG: hypothetical protein A3D52_02110 [Candidatus Taylorbacteria bacterium RIFCSPHIGHO2_02_FULL_44_36]|uniref:Uncharacterized protein n=1 Tax=Candidatus Taylorbacteria bacterium RIFCSPLOWO2_12_FULL_44_15c TaxID=1802333 RepID=A0A1G2P8Y1_9BACT|nr:MAG: hypothetical protein A3D52_02110 [Candidatus Taylorbacteria bacterium RIFCSPHIGHO2_02_FULL_44_36]OHA38317.1 MAG: hypothetical protein A3I97_02235 [Candidatus Taylorbacteria bacterium RIFCSPLOWO2_02_FULL_44_35]OHA44052.1 MAG: hypothetical protein A3G03_00665 [Candidatus Taylorbacteria bacterium RIFCSPLOWO2_12_FULL_44_15c]